MEPRKSANTTSRPLKRNLESPYAAIDVMRSWRSTVVNATNAAFKKKRRTGRGALVSTVSYFSQWRSGVAFVSGSSLPPGPRRIATWPASFLTSIALTGRISAMGGIGVLGGWSETSSIHTRGVISTAARRERIQYDDALRIDAVPVRTAPKRG